MLVLAVAEVFASRLFRSIVFLSLSNHLLSSLVCWCSAFCHTTAACVSEKVHYAIPVPLLFVAMCTHQNVRQGHQQSIDGARSGWRRNARALRDDGKTKQNAPLHRLDDIHSGTQISYCTDRSDSREAGSRKKSYSESEGKDKRENIVSYVALRRLCWSLLLQSCLLPGCFAPL